MMDTEKEGERKKPLLFLMSREPRMSPRLRELMLTVISDDPRIPPIMHMLTHFVRCEEILDWLVRNRMRGSNFYCWLKEDFEGSVLKLGGFVLAKIKKGEMDVVKFGIDWRP